MSETCEPYLSDFCGPTTTTGPPQTTTTTAPPPPSLERHPDTGADPGLFLLGAFFLLCGISVVILAMALRKMDRK